MSEKIIEAYPLAWPDGQRRSKSRHYGPFQQTLSSAQDGLYEELRKLGGVSNIVVSSNCGPRKKDGTLYANADTKPADPGVAVYFTRNNIRQCIACDSYHWVHFNIHAIALTLNALRGISRWGSTEMMDRAFTGFSALPAPTALENWWTVLGVDREASEETVSARYRELVLQQHPDAGGSHDEMARINVAMDAFRAEREI